MIAGWILYCSALGVILAIAAHPLERMVHQRGGATRRVWAIALVATLLLPLSALARRDVAPATQLGGAVEATVTTETVARGVDALAPLDGVLGVGWATASALLVILFLAAAAATALRRLRWTEQRVDDVDVLVSDDTGPAVVGILHSRIVLPRWVLELPLSERTMMLRHEQEHLAAGDPRLLALGALAAVAMPWNPAVWFMLRRIRLAIEVDCDRRVVRSGELDLRRYAELLLSVGARRRLPAYGVGFSVGRPFLEQRIDRMTEPEAERKVAHAVLVAVGVAGVIAAAWSLPQPVRAADLALDVACETGGGTAKVSQRLLEASDWST